ncbi:hypothetical protein [Sphingobacterium spiritivorum]|uniref:hypothetical protein n=1 Tax=Sphingobacterium spiritivorum TaxID=258 RepID=UPI00191A7EBC|nr:hypothetical protein [Sphingobacterium spiritivorum]QQT24852.1 hypothetical protein I6J02_14060 [Sphingobacterium spiritivorum]
MKNKALTYGLIIVVIALWGYIIYTIFASVSEDNTTAVIRASTIENETVNLNYYRIKDDVLLTLDYEDPMLRGMDIPQENTDAPAVTSPNPAAYFTPAPVLPQTKVDYLGYIENENGRNATAILAIQGKQNMANAGDQLQGVKVLQIKSTFVKVQVDGESKIIYKDED